jgi:methionyl-tRNA synthetase
MPQESIQFISELSNIHPFFIILAIVWSLVWKGLALWKSAGLRQKHWFIAILVVNTLGILEIIYLFFIARKYKVEVIEKSE